jgi:hypothetical protein
MRTRLYFFVLFDHLFQLFVENRNFFFQLFVDVYTQNTPPYHRPCVADLFFACPLFLMIKRVGGGQFFVYNTRSFFSSCQKDPTPEHRIKYSGIRPESYFNHDSKYYCIMLLLFNSTFKFIFI